MAVETGKLVAPVKWAQRQDTLFVTIDLPDVVKDTAKIELTDEMLKFSGQSEGKDYELELEFYKEAKGIDSSSEDSKYSIKPRSINFLLVKKEEGFWPRLLENKQLQKTNVKVDFDKWQDSDEEDDAGFNTEGMEGLGGMMGGAGGMPGMGGGMPGMGGGMPGMEGMDMAALMEQMKGMGGMPGMDGMDGGDDGDEEADSDDDDLPDLEEDAPPAAPEAATTEAE
ncbi:Protein wos2 (p21) [Durusdinium trenchii]|uniref:Protein wos2 (p21) n=1 Tax=Durusdinium trenchii TaxID=1381693 RepID=A0ABP0R126_9DINO